MEYLEKSSQSIVLKCFGYYLLIDRPLPRMQASAFSAWDRCCNVFYSLMMSPLRLLARLFPVHFTLSLLSHSAGRRFITLRNKTWIKLWVLEHHNLSIKSPSFFYVLQILIGLVQVKCWTGATAEDINDMQIQSLAWVYIWTQISTVSGVAQHIVQ